MEEMNVVSGQTIFKDGEKPSFFFLIKDGKFKVGSETFPAGSFVALVEYFLDMEMSSDVVAESDGVIIKYTDSDVSENEEEFEKVLKYAVESLNASLAGSVDKVVVSDLEKSVDVAKLAEIAEEIGEDELLSALEEMVSLQKLPEIPGDPEKAKAVVEMVSKEEDIIKYALHRIAFVKKFPGREESKEYLMEALRTYMDELEDRYGARYVAKLAILLYPDDEIIIDVLRKLVKILRDSKDPEWFEYLERLLVAFPEEEVRIDEIS